MFTIMEARGKHRSGHDSPCCQFLPYQLATQLSLTRSVIAQRMVLNRYVDGHPWSSLMLDTNHLTNR